jgi:hypothetical protein
MKEKKCKNEKVEKEQVTEKFSFRVHATSIA